jgi:ABC-type anion transport system duplicated permease subunit
MPSEEFSTILWREQDEIIKMSSFYKTSWIFIVLVYRNKSPQVDIPLLKVLQMHPEKIYFPLISYQQ